MRPTLMQSSSSSSFLVLCRIPSIPQAQVLDKVDMPVALDRGSGPDVQKIVEVTGMDARRCATTGAGWWIQTVQMCSSWTRLSCPL